MYAYESYNEYTEIKPIDDHNIESSATITFPPMELTYHYATFHRIWDYITLSMIGAHFDASIPYMGNESFESRLAVTLRDLHVVMPAATSAATANAPHAIVQVGTLTSVKLQRSEEGFAKGDGGMLITLHDVAILVSDATASGFASPLAVANSPSTEEDADEVEEVEDRDDESKAAAADTSVVLALPQLRARMEYPMLVGGGITRGVPELTVSILPPPHVLLRATPWQLSVMTAVYLYNFGKYAVYVNPFPVLPDDHIVLHLKLEHPSAVFALVDTETMLPAIEMSLHGFKLDMRWRQDYSAVCRLLLNGFAVEGAAGAQCPVAKRGSQQAVTGCSAAGFWR